MEYWILALESEKSTGKHRQGGCGVPTDASQVQWENHKFLWQATFLTTTTIRYGCWAQKQEAYPTVGFAARKTCQQLLLLISALPNMLHLWRPKPLYILILMHHYPCFGGIRPGRAWNTVLVWWEWHISYIVLPAILVSLIKKNNLFGNSHYSKSVTHWT